MLELETVILLVDDEPAFVETFSKRLKKRGIERKVPYRCGNTRCVNACYGWY
jgi:ActR/RegA family two-component response regulator